ncbi:MAG: cation diffusion facilitator family transporter [Ruminococcus sp.]|nr:cation diffusion facilitator family transporter [Ruminococcus sp.]
MIRFLLRKWIPDSDNIKDPIVQKAYGTCSSVIGICCNLLLFLIKYLAGVLSGSIAIISDAFNNLSDCATCFITIFGYKLAAKPADKGHQFGYGRMEYFTSLIMAVIIALVGFELLRNSIEKLIHQETITFQFLSLIILLLSIGVKLWMMHFNTVLGDKIHASTLLAVAKDSHNDVIATTATIFVLISSLVTDFPVDGIISILVSLLILKSAFDILRETVNDLLGKPADSEVVKEIRTRILSHSRIEEIHDLILHDYGPGKIFGSCRVEVQADANLVQIHSVVDSIEREIYNSMHILMTIHMDPIEFDNEEVQAYKEQMESIIHKLDNSFSLHDFRLVCGTSTKRLVFDLVVPFSCDYDDAELETIIQTELQREDPTCTATILFDRDYT